jgi:hypothetical protein
MPHTEFVSPDGKKWPSVTQIVDVINKPFLYRWYGKHGNKRATRILKASGTVGSAFHDAVEKRLTGTSFVDLLPTLSSRTKYMMGEFEKFVDEYDLRPLKLEGKVINEPLHYHGTYDALCSVKLGRKRKNIICDWKSSNSVHDSYAIQLCLYNMGLPKEEQVDEGWIIRVGKKRSKPELEVKKFENLKGFEHVALACRELWDFMNRQGAFEC